MSGPAGVTLRHIDPATITDDDVRAFANFANALREEREPTDPPRSEASFRANFAGLAAVESAIIDWWFVEVDGAMAGHVFSIAEQGDDNRHLAHTTLEVIAPLRRRGAGSALLRRAAAFAAEQDRTMLQTDTSDRISAGDAFAEHFGAKLGIRNTTSQLVLADLDHDRLARWVSQGEAQRDRFELGYWIGPFPDEELEAIAALHEVMNTAPTDGLDIEDERTTPERLRDLEAYFASRGTERWTAYVRERATDALVGYTEVYWEPHNPENLGQGDTAVRIPYRGNGLGKWLKAAMLQCVLAERPVAKRVRTSNASSNDAMLGINVTLGFRPYQASSVWQVEVATVLERLGGGAA